MNSWPKWSQGTHAWSTWNMEVAGVCKSSWKGTEWDYEVTEAKRLSGNGIPNWSGKSFNQKLN